MLNNHPRKLLIAMAVFSISVTFILSLFIYFFYITDKGPAVNCSSFFLVQRDLQTKGEMSFSIDGKDNGKMSISATVRDGNNNVQHQILRDVIFKYRYEKDGYLAIKMSEIRKKAIDDMPNDYFNRYIYDFSAKNQRMRITVVGDGFLLWNDFSPVMVCNNMKTD